MPQHIAIKSVINSIQLKKYSNAETRNVYYSPQGRTLLAGEARQICLLLGTPWSPSKKYTKFRAYVDNQLTTGANISLTVLRPPHERTLVGQPKVGCGGDGTVLLNLLQRLSQNHQPINIARDARQRLALPKDRRVMAGLFSSPLTGCLWTVSFARSVTSFLHSSVPFRVVL